MQKGSTRNLVKTLLWQFTAFGLVIPALARNDHVSNIIR